MYCYYNIYSAHKYVGVSTKKVYCKSSDFLPFRCSPQNKNQRHPGSPFQTSSVFKNLWKISESLEKVYLNTVYHRLRIP